MAVIFENLNYSDLMAVTFAFGALLLASVFLLIIAKINKSFSVNEAVPDWISKPVLDINDLADKAASFVVLYSVIFCAVYLFFFASMKYVTSLSVGALAIFFFVTTYLLNWMKNKIKPLTEKIFKSKENFFAEAYLMAVEDLYYSLELGEVVDLIVQNIKDHFYPNRVAVLLKNADRFDIFDGWSGEHEPITGSFTLRKDSRLINKLHTEHKPLYADLFDEADRIGEQEDFFSFLDKQNFKIVAPIIFAEEVIGLVLMGDKRSRQPYLDYEMRFIGNLCLSAGLAINNFHKSVAMIKQEEGLKKKLERDVENKNKEFLAKNQELQIINATADDSEQKIKMLTKELEILQKLAKHKGYL